MNILYLITGLTLGGAETITINLANNLKSKGHKVCIVYLSGEVVVKVPNGMPLYNLEMKKTPIAFIKSIKKAKKIINDLNPDVIHANMFHAIFFARILRLFIKIPRLICTEHSNNYHGNFRRLIEGKTDFLSDLNTNVSEQATEYFIREGLFSRKKSMTVYNGVDITRFSKKENLNIRRELCINNDSYVFINISRFNEAKDHETLINAFNIVHKYNSNSYLLCVGSGELLEERKKQAEELGLSENVLFVGAKNNTEDFYNASDCFVLSSAWEGFGLVLVEAMACELEIVSTDCGGTKEIVPDNNYLVPVKDAVLLSNKMLEVMKHSAEEKKQNGVYNRSSIKKFDIELIANKWIDLYQG